MTDVANLTALINAASQARDKRTNYVVDSGVVTTKVGGVTIELTTGQAIKVRDAYNANLDAIAAAAALVPHL